MIQGVRVSRLNIFFKMLKYLRIFYCVKTFMDSGD